MFFIIKVTLVFVIYKSLYAVIIFKSNIAQG